MTTDKSTRSARLASVAAATGVALACGTNYAYSAWGPDYAERMNLSATQSNVIGMAGNIGMYATGIPSGILIDHKGPKVGVLVGAIALACGYFPIYRSYALGTTFGAVSLSFLSFCSFLTGFGSCTAFSAAIKTATHNWPDHRGTATAFPMSGFGLSAFFFATIAHLVTDDTGKFLLLLASGTVCLNGICFFFIRLIPSKTSSYSALATDDDDEDPDDNTLHLAKSRSHDSDVAPRPGESNAHYVDRDGLLHPGRTEGNGVYGGTASLEPGTLETAHAPGSDQGDSGDEAYTHRGRGQADVTGLALLKHVEFWQLFTMMALLSGVGLMTINNIGNDAKALWYKQDPTAPPSFITGREQMHTSILSVGSFLGRFLSGVGSDIIVRRLKASRFWCLVISAGVFILAQLLALSISNPNYLFLVSTLTGVAYGALFGCFPALTADAFGVSGMSLNWGFMLGAPTITGNVYNLVYGRIYDSHTPQDDLGKKLACPDGLGCYRNAYFLTLASSVAGILVSLWCVRWERRKQMRARHVRDV